MKFDVELRKSLILVVDDDEMLIYLFCSFLNSKGFETITAGSISEAKKILQTDDRVDLVLLDYQLGDGVGLDLLEKNSVTTYCKPVPVIMISANDEPEFLEKCFASGINDYIIKPVNLSLLALKVDAIIKSILMQDVIADQKAKLEKFKGEAEREEQIAKFTYEYLLRQYSRPQDGIEIWLRSFAAFSGDMALAKKSPSGSLYFMLADATGHGLSAAMTIMPVLSVFNSMAAKGFHVQQIVAELNRKLVSDTPDDRFVAASVFEINPIRHEMNVWNGGMPSVYWMNKGEIVHEFKSTHMALGILDEDSFDANIETISLPKEGFLFTFTDGLSEQENKLGIPFSVERILAILAQSSDNILPKIAAALAAHADGKDYDDDVSICLIDPVRVFGKHEYLFENVNHQLVMVKPPTPFSWQIKLTGKKLEQCDIAPLCNHFLQQLACDQALCQKIFSIVAEMVSNAIDHGLLKLSSSLKENPEGFMLYFSEREKRMKKLTEKDYVMVKVSWDSDFVPKRLVIEVEDSGEGYSLAPTQDELQEKYYGRGSNLIRRLSESVEIFPPGNKIRAIIK